MDREEIGYFEDKRLEEFGELLGISNLMTSYEYLKEGEEDVREWDSFVELSGNGIADDIWQEDQSEREEEREVLTRELTEPGLLLYEVKRQGMYPQNRSDQNGIRGFMVKLDGPFCRRRKQ